MYTISGDMFRGSIIDSEYMGLSTAMIINELRPDAVCIGNHEIDYGITHSLMLEKIADFPIINCNIYVKYFDKRLYMPYYIKEIGGSRFLFIGVITEKMTNQLTMDKTVGPYIEVRDPVEEINKVPVPDDKRITLGLIDYLVKSAESNFGGNIESLTGSKPISASSDILAELENALKGKENIVLPSTHRFNRIFKDHSVLCPSEG